MKYLKPIPLAGFISALTLGAAMNVSAGTTVNGGTVHFKGEVVNAACAVNTNSLDQTVLLGQVRTAKLAKEGDKSSPVGFNIELNDCDTTVSSFASIIFDGVSVGGKADVLALQGSAAGGATNVGVQIQDALGVPVVLGFAGSVPHRLTDGTNKIPFQAVYYATGQATAGTANADATFKVEYL